MKSLYETIFDTTATPDDFLVRPKSKKELQRIITEHIKQIKPKPGEEVDLNWIDISKVDDLSDLFRYTNYIPVIDKWDITHVMDFGYMFADNEYIVRSPLPRLQTKLLQIDCYGGMFLNCTSLQVAPELPATQLTNFCYNSMFRNCTSLTHAPELPAMELKENCYLNMFAGCTSLEVTPKLPATKLAIGCYASMFTDCSSLEVAPELPAKKLKIDCYMEMFKNCSNLKAKAKIPTGANLNGYTALEMYEGCPNIE